MSATLTPPTDGLGSSALHGLAVALKPGAEASAPIPAIPSTIAETGLPVSMIEQLILKHLYFRIEMTGRDLASAMGLRFSIIDEMLAVQKRQHQVETRRSLGIGNMSSAFALTEAGRNLAREHMENNQYAGPAPVPLAQYTAMVRRQRPKEGWLTPALLAEAFGHLVVSQQILARIGPAVNGNKSFLIYGQPGNGKTVLAEALFRIESEPIYIPYAIECQGNIVQMYDPIYHQKIEYQASSVSAVSVENPHDARWFRARRPFLITGGELTFDMLDLSFNQNAKFYEAPYQLKANNGIYLIDDFGRQKATPAEVLNRWIVPMERNVDYLSFRTGGKMTAPFEAFLIFSTNLKPEQLGDEAFLRRIQYKMLLRNPTVEEFIRIFERFCASRELEYDVGLTDRFIAKHYRSTGKPFRRCHPRDIITHAIDAIHFERRPFKLTEELLDDAFASCFLENLDVDA